MKSIFVMCVIVAGLAFVSAQAADAKENYAKQCAKCHAATGNGDTKMGKKLGIKDYTDAKIQAALKDEAALKAIKEGVKDKDGKVVMKPAEGLSDDDAKALMKYMRTFKK